MRALKEQLAKAKQEESLARRQAEKAIYGLSIRKAQPEESQNLNRLSKVEADVREKFERQRLALKEQLKKLEVEEQVTLRKLATERNQLSNPKPENRESPAGDKLDRILERLDQIERRLERLERGSPASGSRRQ